MVASLFNVAKRQWGKRGDRTHVDGSSSEFIQLCHCLHISGLQYQQPLRISQLFIAVDR